MSNNWSTIQDDKAITLQTIQDYNLIFISVQPDTTYFHWQVEIYLYQFAKHGIIDRCYALFGYTGDKPSEYAKRLEKKYPNIKFYKDTRKSNNYPPTIRPHILAKFFKENPSFGKNVFYHDSDIFLVNLPRFDYMLTHRDASNTTYLSDTISYIGYEYIKECSERYKRKYPSLRDLDIFYGMCDEVGVSYSMVINNQNISGGAQYLFKNIDYKFWEQCEEKCEKLYAYLSKYEKDYPISNHIQKWTTDMWVILWLYWKNGGKTLIHKELNFSWATSTAKEYKLYNIFHLAGVIDSNSSDKFQKNNFKNLNVFDAYYSNPRIFDHISKENATYEYVKVIKEYVRDVYLYERGLNKKYIPIIDTNTVKSYSKSKLIPQLIPQLNKINNVNEVKRFKINIQNIYADIYKFDENIKCCGKNIWRSENKMFIIFWTGIKWVLTYSKYENQIGPNCGGIISTHSVNPYTDVNNWNVNELTISLL